MYFKQINEKQAINFVNKLLTFYKRIDNGSLDTILTSRDVESQRNNVGWYQHIGDQHKLFINIPNMLYAQSAIEQGMMDYDGLYAFLALCTGHEFRHFLQGRVIYEGQEIDGFTQEDVFNSELMLYVRYFFDGYYLLNKGNVKYELDAERYSIISGIKYLKETYPCIDAEKSMLDAVNFYAGIQSQDGIISTLPLGCKSIDEVIQELQKKIKSNERIPRIDKTLFVHSLRFYQNHLYYGLNDEQVITEELLQQYYNEPNGSKRDLLIVKRILSLLKRPEESLEEFPQLKMRYRNKSL